MGNWDAAVNRNFKKDAQGRVVFFPLSVFGPGREIKPGTEASLKRFLRAFQWGAAPLALAFVFLDMRGVWYVLGVYYALFFGGELLLLRGSRPSPERLSLAHYVAGTACHAGFAGLWCTAAAGALLAALCVYVLVLDDTFLSNRLLGLLGTLVFAFYSFVSAWALYSKYRSCPK